MKKLYLISLILFLSNFIIAQTVIYVDINATGLNDGSSWSNAFVNVQDGIDSANSTTPKAEVWIAEGVYTPTSFLSDANASPQTGNEYKSFLMYAGVDVYGGFEGTETTSTIGIIGGRQLDSTGIAWNFAHPTIFDGAGSYHTVWFGTNGFETFSSFGVSGLYRPKRLTAPSNLNGVTLKNGYANIGGVIENTTTSKKNFMHMSGGGACFAGNSYMSNCIVENSKAKFGGGGVVLYDLSSVDYSMIRNNEVTGAHFDYTILFTTYDYWKACGGGILTLADTANSTFIRNSYIYNNLAQAMNGTIGENTNEGGGLHITNATVLNCVIESNNIQVRNNNDPGGESSCGGGIFIYGKGIVDSCELFDNGYLNNLGGNAAAIWADCEYGIFGPTNGSEITISNSYIHSNRHGNAVLFNARPAIMYNCRIIDNEGYGVGHYGNAKDCQTINCVIANNSRGIYVAADSDGNNQIINSTIVNNGSGGGIAASGDAIIDNCIFWGNQGTPGLSNATISYSAFSYLPLPTGTANISIDAINSNGPKFVDPSSAAGAGVPFCDTADWSLDSLSLCVNLGDASKIPASYTVDLANNPRLVSCEIDMGAYESPFGVFVIANDTSFCGSGDVNLSASSYGAQTWYESDGVTQIMTSVVSNVDSSQYFIVVADAGACPAVTDTLFVRIDTTSAYFTSVMSDTAVCPGSIVDFMAEGYGDITWYFMNMAEMNDTNTIVNVDTSYIVQISNACATTALVDTIYLTIVAPNPYVIGMNDTVICYGENLTLNAIGAGAFIWYPFGSTTPLSSTTINVVTNEVYVVEAQNVCGIKYDTVSVDVFQALQPSFTYFESTPGIPQTEVTFVNTSSSMGEYDFTWYFGDGNSELNNNNTVLHLYNNANSYDAILSASDTTYACEATDTITIIIPDYASINEDMTSDIKVYPLPARSNIYIESPKTIKQLEIYNIEGQIMMSVLPNSNFVHLNVSELSQGTYAMKILTSDGICVRRIILQ